jgi:hypothetical protein
MTVGLASVLVGIINVATSKMPDSVRKTRSKTLGDTYKSMGRRQLNNTR